MIWILATLNLLMLLTLTALYIHTQRLTKHVNALTEYVDVLGKGLIQTASNVDVLHTCAELHTEVIQQILTTTPKTPTTEPPTVADLVKRLDEEGNLL